MPLETPKMRALAAEGYRSCGSRRILLFSLVLARLEGAPFQTTYEPGAPAFAIFEGWVTQTQALVMPSAVRRCRTESKHPYCHHKTNSHRLIANALRAAAITSLFSVLVMSSDT